MTITNILVRADASKKIGFGHFMRTLALISCLKNQNIQIDFASYQLDSDLKSQLTNLQCRIIELNSIHDTETLIQYKQQWDLVIVDHYQLDVRWESQLRQTCQTILVIDDLANRFHDCDYLVDQNYYFNAKQRYQNYVHEKTILLLGPDFVLLRPNFINKILTPLNTNNRLFISLGGGDNSNYLWRILYACKQLASHFNFDVVITKAYSQLNEIKHFCSLDSRFNVYQDVIDMASIMAKATLSLGAGGSMTWEKCYLGLPSIVTATADNQIEVAENLHQLGVIHYLGKITQLNKDRLLVAVTSLIKDTKKITSMRQLGKQLVDGNGCKRVINALRNGHG